MLKFLSSSYVGSDQIKITNFEVEGCTTLPCVFHKGTNATVTIEITTNIALASLKNLIYGQIAGVNVPFNFPQADACANGVTCPSTAGGVYSQTISLPILNEYPSLSLLVQFQVNDQDKKKQACALFPVKLQ